MKNIDKKIIGRTVIFVVLLLFIIAIMATELKAADAIQWEIKLEFDEPGEAYDWVAFGETSDAIDGPPVDSYDEPKPPAIIGPYIRVWFNDSLPMPYNILLKDFRKYPDNSKTWNLTVLWVPLDYNSSTIITLSWTITNIANLEYDSMQLYKAGSPVSDLLVDTSYSFICPANTPQQFEIICESETSNGIIDNIETSYLILALIIIVIIVLLVVYWKTKR